MDLLTVFADLSELSRNQPGNSLEAEPGNPVHSPREYFHSYLQSLDVERAGVPEGFQAQADAGCSATTASPAWTARRSSRRRSSGSSWPSSGWRAATRSRRPSCCGSGWPSAPPAEPLRERAGLALEHLIEATQVRFPAVSDLARGVVFRWFAQPLLRRNRARVYAAVRERPALPGP